MAKIKFSDGTEQNIYLPTPEEMDRDEEMFLNSIPEELYKLMGVSKKSVLKSFDRVKGKG